MHMNIRIAVVSLWAEDVPAAAHFYRDVVGLKLLPHHDGDCLHFDVESCILTIVHGRPALPPDPGPRFPVVAFSIPELEPAIEKLHLHGVDLPWAVETNAAGRWVMFRDPAGNLVELVEFNT
jgi:catechol 2,3-dioxygenase-like lactoylglutathione lyase family enzyme